MLPLLLAFCVFTPGIVADTLDEGAGEAGSRREYLVPELANATFKLDEGPRPFRRRIALSPGYGQVGAAPLYLLRVAFNPEHNFGYEVGLAHNPTSTLHALLHTFSIQLRHPLRSRAQPYVTLGYGMATVFPGGAINARAVSKNAISVGGGLEFYLRDDVAIRGEIRSLTVVDRDPDLDASVAYHYREFTLGFAFYRKLGR
jgi:hypothetical protein